MVMGGYGWVWVVMGGYRWNWVVMGGYGRLWVVMGGYGWLWVVVCGYGSAFVDWKQAFNRQDPTLGIESFFKNGVRSSLIPALINYFHGRKMYVKWHKKESKRRNLNGGLIPLAD